MIRRQAVLLAALSLISAPLVEAASFRDTEYTRYEGAFAYLKERNVVQGHGDGLGYPHNPLSRAEALKVVLELEGSHKDLVAMFKQRMPPIGLFADVDQRAWYAPYVEAGFQAGIVNGYGNGYFGPNDALRTEEAVAMLMRAFRLNKESTEAKYSDAINNVSGQWYTPSINAAIARNLFSKKELLRIGYVVTRGQFFDIAYRLGIVRDEKLVSYDKPEPEPPAAPPSNYAVQPVTSERPAVSRATDQTLVQYASDKYFSITIPKLGIEKFTVTHPANPFTSEGMLSPLKNGVGHLFGYPGGGSTVMIYAHSSSFPWDTSLFTKAFRRINELKKGDRVYVTYNNHLHVYEISHNATVPAGNVGPFGATGEELILYTCWPPDSISKRFLQFAYPVQTIALR